MIKILDNFLPQDQFKPIQDFFFSSELYWLWNDSIAGENDNLNNFQFNHVFFNTRNPYLDRKYSPYCNYLKPIFIKLVPINPAPPVTIIRIQLIPFREYQDHAL